MSADVIPFDPKAAATAVWADGAVSSKEARALLGNLGRTAFYELVGTGALATKKQGRRLLISRRSITLYLASLPDATHGGS